MQGEEKEMRSPEGHFFFKKKKRLKLEEEKKFVSDSWEVNSFTKAYYLQAS